MKKNIAMLLFAAVLCGQSVCVRAAAEDTLSEIEQKLPSVELLVERCEAAGIDIGYERIDYNVIKDFIKYGREDISWGHTERAEYVATELDKMYTDLYSRLSSYYFGKAEPKSVKRNTVKGFSGVSNGGFVNKSKGRVFFNGYVTPYWTGRDTLTDMERFQDFGADIVQIEITPNDVIYSPDSINGWNVNKNNGVDAAAAVVSGGAENTEKALRVTNKSGQAANVYINFTQGIAVKAQTTYEYTFKAKATNIKGVYFYPNGWTDESKAARVSLGSGSYDWREFTCKFTTGADVSSLTAMFVCENTTEELLLDGISLKEVGSSKNLVQNGGFEEEGNTSEHFKAWTAPVDNLITRFLDSAAENNIMVDVLIQPATFTRLANMYPDIAKPSSGVGYDINSDMAKEALNLYVKTVMERIKDHPALLSVCISNEPNYDTRDDTENLAAYRAYLKELYNNDKTALIGAYGLGEHKGFDSVEFPDDTRKRKFYEWVRFNNKFTSDWNSYVAGLVKDYAPGVRVHSKMMSLFGSGDSVKWGTDPEEFNAFSDLSGNDCYGFIEHPTGDGVVYKLMWYDLLKSIAPDKPIINSEDHIIVDGSTNYSAENTKHVATDIWQGALHGRDASVLWLWNRSSSETSTTYGNILYRPDAVSVAGKRSLDLNRLSAEVDALTNKKNYVTILWSDTSFIYNTQNTLAVYKAALFAGANPDFITERQLIEGKKPSGVLVIPGAENVRSEAFDKIKAYAASGGRVWAVGDNCLAKTEQNKSTSGSVAYEKKLAEGAAKAEFEKLAAPIVRASDGNYLEKVEITSVAYKGETLVNLCSYDWNEEKTVKFDGVAINLLTDERFKGSVTLAPYEPMLLKITDSWYEFEAVQDSDCPMNFSVKLKNKNNADCTGKIYFNVFDKDGNLQNAVVYDNKLIKSGKTGTASYSGEADENTYRAVVGAVIDGEKYSEEFFVN